jgi:hypothetical protein
LSELFEGRLEITIEGVGTQTMTFESEPIASHVALVQCLLTNHLVFCSDVSNSPWKIISFDRAAGKLVVCPVK